MSNSKSFTKGATRYRVAALLTGLVVFTTAVVPTAEAKPLTPEEIARVAPAPATIALAVNHPGYTVNAGLIPGDNLWATSSDDATGWVHIAIPESDGSNWHIVSVSSPRHWERVASGHYRHLRGSRWQTGLDDHGLP